MVMPVFPIQKRLEVSLQAFSDSKKVGGFFTSAEAQEAIIREYAKNNPQIHLEKVYADPGKSGKDTNRPGYQKMCQRIAQGGIDIVIAYKLDRMGRNDDDLHSLFRLLSDYNTFAFLATIIYLLYIQTGLILTKLRTANI